MQSTRNLKLLYKVGFLLAFGAALPAYIQTSFLTEFADEKFVGLFFVLAHLLSLFVINFLTATIKKFSNYRVAITLLALYILSLLALTSVTSILLVIVFFTLYLLTSSFLWVNIDIFLEDSTSNRKTGSVRTTFNTWMNSAWVLAPPITGYIVGMDNYQPVFFVAAFLLLCVLIVLHLNRNRLSHKITYHHITVMRELREVLRTTRLRIFFSLTFLLHLFYVFAVLYIPLYLHQHIGFPWTTIGWMFTVMLLPFIVVEIPAGRFADRYYREKEIFALGFFILSISLAAIFFYRSDGVVVWTTILFASRVGAALVEAMRDTYFYKVVDKEDIAAINLFWNIKLIAYMIGPIVGSSILLFAEFEHIFLVLGIVMLWGTVRAFRLRDV